MIRIGLFLALGLAVSCKSPKNTAHTLDTTKPESEHRQEITVVDEKAPPVNDTITKNYHLAVVRKLDCGYIVDITVQEGFSLYFNPTNLASKFEVDGLRLKIKYRRGAETTWGCIKYAQVELVEAFAVR